MLAIAPTLGAGITAAVKGVFGTPAGAAGGGGSNGNGAGIRIEQSVPVLTKSISDLTKTLAPSMGAPGSGNIGDTLATGDTLAGVGKLGKLASIEKSIGTFAGLMANPFGDKGGLPGVNGQPGKDLGHFSTLGAAAAGADVALGAFTAVSEFKKGGARGALGGTSAVLGTAAALTAGVPILGEVLGIAAIGTGLVKSLLGDPKIQRQQEISKKLFLDQYEAPLAQNISSSTMGTYADLGRDGNIRQSSLSPYQRVTTPYLDLPYRFNVPGTQSSQFGGGGPITINNNVTNHVAAMDAGSFETFLKKNPNALMEGVSHGLTFGASRATQSIKAVVGMG
jgi:hypothetical protein